MHIIIVGDDVRGGNPRLLEANVDWAIYIWDTRDVLETGSCKLSTDYSMWSRFVKVAHDNYEPLKGSVAPAIADKLKKLYAHECISMEAFKFANGREVKAAKAIKPIKVITMQWATGGVGQGQRWQDNKQRLEASREVEIECIAATDKSLYDKYGDQHRMTSCKIDGKEVTLDDIEFLDEEVKPAIRAKQESKHQKLTVRERWELAKQSTDPEEAQIARTNFKEWKERYDN